MTKTTCAAKNVYETYGGEGVSRTGTEDDIGKQNASVSKTRTVGERVQSEKWITPRKKKMYRSSTSVEEMIGSFGFIITGPSMSVWRKWGGGGGQRV
jgi:hypothetical protein